jgi:hypothetical protein
MHQVLAKSLDSDQGDMGRVIDFFIYLVDSCDIPSIHMLTRNMAVMFPEIISLTFCFEHQCEIVSFLLNMIISELKSIHVILAITGDEENCLFFPQAKLFELRSLARV